MSSPNKENFNHQLDTQKQQPSLIGQKIGYIRVSSIDQKIDRQLIDIPLDKVFVDKISAKNFDRPALNDLLDYIREGDTLFVHSMDRLARNLDHLRTIVFDLTSKGITIKFLKEGLTFSKEDSPLSKLILSVMGAIAEFERKLIRERQMEGIFLAKQRGVYSKTGRKEKLSPDQVAILLKHAELGVSKSKIARMFSVGRDTVYRYLRKQ